MTETVYEIAGGGKDGKRRRLSEIVRGLILPPKETPTIEPPTLSDYQPVYAESHDVPREVLSQMSESMSKLAETVEQSTSVIEQFRLSYAKVKARLRKPRVIEAILRPWLARPRVKKMGGKKARRILMGWPRPVKCPTCRQPTRQVSSPMTDGKVPFGYRMCLGCKTIFPNTAPERV